MEKIDRTENLMAQKYDLLASKFHQAYLKEKGRGREAMTLAMEKAHKQLVAAGEFSAEQGRELAEYLARDLDQTIAAAEKLGDAAKEKLNPSRLGAGALASLVTVLNGTGVSLQSLANKTKSKLIYKTGEMTSAGTLTCTHCGQTVHMKTTGHVPPCPKCKTAEFSKGY